MSAEMSERFLGQEQVAPSSNRRGFERLFLIENIRNAAVVILVNENDQICMVKKMSEFGGKWTLPGGKVDKKEDGTEETWSEAAIRESHEEIGVGNFEFPYHLRMFMGMFGHDSKNRPYFVIAFIAPYKTPSDPEEQPRVKINPEGPNELEKCEFKSIEDILNMNEDEIDERTKVVIMEVKQVLTGEGIYRFLAIEEATESDIAQEVSDSHKGEREFICGELNKLIN